MASTWNQRFLCLRFLAVFLLLLETHGHKSLWFRCDTDCPDALSIKMAWKSPNKCIGKVTDTLPEVCLNWFSVGRLLSSFLSSAFLLFKQLLLLQFTPLSSTHIHSPLHTTLCCLIHFQYLFGPANCSNRLASCFDKFATSSELV